MKVKLICLCFINFVIFTINANALTDAELQTYHETINNLESKLKAINVDSAYSVNSVYISVKGTKPSGTWESFGQGRTLIGVGGSYTKANATGGDYLYSTSTSSHYDYSEEEASISTMEVPIIGSDGSYVVGDEKTEMMASANNQTPYVSVYFWKRTK